MIAKHQIDAVNVTLKVDDKQTLFVLLESQGAIGRMGTGAVDNQETELFLGVSHDDLFDRFMARVTDELLSQAGGYAHPQRVGPTCQLNISFRAWEESLDFEFVYGAESQGPPDEICDLVMWAIELTEPWYVEQKKGEPPLFRGKPGKIGEPPEA